MSSNENKPNNEEEDQFLYLPRPPSGNNGGFGDQSFKGKMKRKMAENPFVPIGLFATTVALSYGLFQMKTGNKRMSQLMMRARIAAQGFTVCAILAGVLYKTPSKK